MPDNAPQSSGAPPLQKAFGATSQTAVQIPPDAALIIDFGAAEEGADYLKKLGDTVEDLRRRHIPIVWVTMSDRNKLHPPQGDPGDPNSPPRSLSEMEQEGYGHLDDATRKFMEEHGPRANEAIYEKFFKSALIDPKDYEKNQPMQDILLDDYLPEYRDEARKNLPTSQTSDSLADYMEKAGYKRPLIVGAVSNNCCAETAAWAVRKNMQPMIARDAVLSWNVDETRTKVDRKIHHLIWRKDENDSSEDAFHTAKMKAKLETIAADQKDARHFSDQNVADIRAIPFPSVDEALANAPVLENAPGAAPVRSAPAAPAPAQG